MKRSKFTMLDQWTNLVLMDELPNFLIVVPFLTEKNINTFGFRLIKDGAIWPSVFPCLRCV
ncbi:hypothetical protein C481_11575 [Natrialba asiatica DSM 12278]|uniref:Uncharacterized protein n=1 Tax=Natrialba asiatica (strain ATCC 700177 / DSM 12278 / JCM 9576 / FERM P-10747 / NBRC 102637 / 172P1) TaxID=29540 RepID=M0ARB4_NATA1|nr:hypothetical protein C481_11575 [Natrialba asiatica DSM 12278]